MNSKLEEIIEATRDRVATARRARPESSMEPTGWRRNFEGALRLEGISLIAEFKRASPSAGSIAQDAHPAAVAMQYEEGGARALSVLTEPYFFQGDLDHLTVARGACSLPALRKDFIIDPYQIPESASVGADAVLLIVAAVEVSLLHDLFDSAKESGLDVLVEIHDERELETALSLEPAIIGINQRNLHTFEVDTSLAARLREQVPAAVVVVAESGIKQSSDLGVLEVAGVDAVLVGETLMRAPDRLAAVRSLIGDR